MWSRASSHLVWFRNFISLIKSFMKTALSVSHCCDGPAIVLNHLVQTNIVIDNKQWQDLSTLKLVYHNYFFFLLMTDRSAESWLAHIHYYLRMRAWPPGNSGSGWDITFNLCQLSLTAALRQSCETPGTCWVSKLLRSIHSVTEKCMYLAYIIQLGYIYKTHYILSMKGLWQGLVVLTSSQSEKQDPS